MRIVGGRHRGRTIEAPAGDRIRPTKDLARESLFNILGHGRFAPGGVSLLQGARVLDAFCGTGALGLEALSRGAAHAIFLDIDAAALRVARGNAAKLGEQSHAEFIAADAKRPPRATTACNLVLLDPPYGEGLAAPALAALDAAGWIAAGAICVLEVGATEDVAVPAGFTHVDERRYGKTKFVILQKG
jgi:16S rRNA (guanine966-N2)-methyltransferase